MDTFNNSDNFAQTWPKRVCVFEFPFHVHFNFKVGCNKPSHGKMAGRFTLTHMYAQGKQNYVNANTRFITK